MKGTSGTIEPVQVSEPLAGALLDCADAREDAAGEQYACGELTAAEYAATCALCDTLRRMATVTMEKGKWDKWNTL